MNVRIRFLLVSAVATLLVSGSSALGQHRVYGPSYHVNRDHVVRDGLGYLINRYYPDLVRQNSTYVVPHLDHQHDGAYYVQNGEYYYIPRSHSGHQPYAPVQLNYGSFSHVDDLASRLETLANEFCLDLYYNYSHNPGFQETYREAYELLQVAKYIHAAEHQRDRREIRRRLRGMDELLHHLQDDVRSWTRQYHRQVGRYGIRAKLEMMESTLHHLMHDVGVRPTSVQTGLEQAPAPYTTAPPPTDS